MDDYLETAIALAHEAGRVMLDHFKMGVAADLKADSSPVTIADETINQIVIDWIRSKYPTHGVIGEEDSVDGSDSRFTWVCDPVDGTLPYTLGIPTNVFCLALVDDGEPVVAVIYDPYMDRMYTAVAAPCSRANTALSASPSPRSSPILGASTNWPTATSSNMTVVVHARQS